MATENEQLLANQRKNLAELQASLSKFQNDPEKLAATNQQISQLEKNIIDTSTRVSMENSVGRTVTQSDGTKETYDSNGILIKSEPPPSSNDQKTVNANQGDTGSNPPPLKTAPSTGVKTETDTENQSNAETERLARQNALTTTTTKTVSNAYTAALNDWRVRLSLAPSAKYLYMDPDIAYAGDKSTHILAPLKSTGGVLFPYMPSISVAYRANYETSEITHTNYKLQFYKGSSVDDIQITADFTAQDTNEAKYLLAVIHFFRSVTKMFYGQDSNPRGGTPPPLCYLSGLGAYQFNKHPIVISSFQYTLPTDVDYIRTETTADWSGSGIATADTAGKRAPNIFQQIRLKMAGAKPGARPPEPIFKNLSSISEENSYVPTKMQIILGAHVIVTRSDISKEFSLEKYASGELIKKGLW